MKTPLEYFKEISRIPRDSKNEKEIRNWLLNWAKERNFNTKTDNAGNILIEVPAKNYESAENAHNIGKNTIVFQGHMDMVCQKTPESKHNFAKDPIKLVQEGDWLKAKDTTLGADNGIGIAMALALADNQEAQHPPLEFLFTVDEETGMTGALQLSSDFISGKTLINIDSEEVGIFTLGCAGGRETLITCPFYTTKLDKSLTVYHLTVTGALGGHSGMDIDKHRANTNVLLSRILFSINKKTNIRLLSVSGGTAHNAIPRHTEAYLAISHETGMTELNLNKEIRRLEEEIKREYKNLEPNLSVILEKNNPSADRKALTEKDSELLVQFFAAFPHGIYRMSPEVENLVETSNNFAIIDWRQNQVEITTSQRSSLYSGLLDISYRIEALSYMAGAETEILTEYPNWEPNMDSPLLKRAIEVYKQLTGKEPQLEVVHAGLECGVIGSKYPGMDMISLGPEIQGAHSPDERLYVPSVEEIYSFIKALTASYCR